MERTNCCLNNKDRNKVVKTKNQWRLRFRKSHAKSVILIITKKTSYKLVETTITYAFRA